MARGKSKTTRPVNPSANYYYTPPAQQSPAPQAALIIHKRLDEMQVEEAILYQEQLLARIKKMQAGMQRYLKYRANSGRHTATDDMYQDNVQLIDELLAVMEEVLEGFKTRRYAP